MTSLDSRAAKIMGWEWVEKCQDCLDIKHSDIGESCYDATIGHDWKWEWDEQNNSSWSPSTHWAHAGILIKWAEITKRIPMEIRWTPGGGDRYLRFGPANPNWDSYPNEVLIPYKTGLLPIVITEAFVKGFEKEKEYEHLTPDFEPYRIDGDVTLKEDLP